MREALEENIEKNSSNDTAKKGRIPEGYVLETIFREKGKSYELWHEPKIGHYIKHEVGAKW